MGKLQLLGEMAGTDKATWHRYCDFYESVLPKEIGALIEIGVKDGASLKMWRSYYLEAIAIYGVDINKCENVEGCRVFQADGTDARLWNQFWPLGFDIIIDDGSHRCSDQRKTFDAAWPTLKPGGFYIIEDVHTSFLDEYADESPTTYEWAMKLPGAMESWRDLSNKSDSGTIIIPKPL